VSIQYTQWSYCHFHLKLCESVIFVLVSNRKLQVQCRLYSNDKDSFIICVISFLLCINDAYIRTIVARHVKFGKDLTLIKVRGGGFG
jgi:hypothetical protein